MKISELVEQLETQRKEHGDIEVIQYCDSYFQHMFVDMLVLVSDKSGHNYIRMSCLWNEEAVPNSEDIR